MLYSIAIILIAGMGSGYLCKKIKLPGLIGMMAVGIIFGPFVFNLLDDSILSISAQLRKIALIIILTRAGLGLDLSVLKKIGRPALLMCFLPASLELIGVVLFGPVLLGITRLEACVLGAVLAAVSPAVVVPRMIKLMENGYGVKQGVPQLILAGASVDDVYVIALFTTFTGMLKGDGFSVIRIVNVPVSILLGIAIGLFAGKVLAWFINKAKVSAVIASFVVLSISFLLVEAEDALSTPITFCSLIAVMFIGIAIKRQDENITSSLSGIFNKMWIIGEVFLFVLVGASVNIKMVGSVGIQIVLLLIVSLIFRMAGVLLCMVRTKLKKKERVFAMLAYTPKATVQAAIGGIPLSLGLACGNVVLCAAVIAIIITAPLGAFAIDMTYKKLLSK